MKHTVTIEIAGAKYRMTTDTEESHLQHLADVVNSRIAELGPKAARTASSAQILAVVALGLAEDLEVAEERRARVEQKTRRTVEAAIARIDQRIAADSELASQVDD